MKIDTCKGFWLYLVSQDKFMINLYKNTPRGAGDNLIKTSPKLRNSLP